LNTVPIIEVLRIQHWIKNFAVWIPIFLTPSEFSVPVATRIGLMFLSFCFVASAVYVINDYVDRESDARHPIKKYRPIARGAIRKNTAIGIIVVFVMIGFGLALAVGNPITLALVAAYFFINIAYSFWLKKFPIIDVGIISCGFILRMETGLQLIDVDPSVWIIVLTALVALFLALGKRRDDLVLGLDAAHRKSIDGYNKQFLDIAVSIILGSLLIGYLIYTTDQHVIEHYGTDKLVLTSAFVIAGILRYLQIMLVEEKSGSPTEILLTDRFLMVTVFLWVASFGAIIY
jgi:4-hydroxybenzoate polyprenyltransferase